MPQKTNPVILTILMAHAAGYPKEEILNSNMWELNSTPELSEFLDLVYSV